MKQLNQTQQKLVEDNHNLIYSFMKKNKLSFDSVEDWYGACAEGLCKAALIFNSDKNIAFSTLAYVCMSNEMKSVLEKKSKEEMCLSLDYYIDDDIQFADFISDNYDKLGEFEFYSIFERHFNRLSNRQKEIVSACVNTDGNLKDVAKNFGITKQRVSKVYNDLLNNIYSDLYGSEAEKV